MKEPSGKIRKAFGFGPSKKGNFSTLGGMSTTSTKLFLFLSLIYTIGTGQDRISVGSLLKEMTDRNQLTLFPNPPYTLKQFSSYDRRSVSSSDSNWFANEDYSQFLRADSLDGRRELVMFDAEGPGAIVRWWMTFTGKGGARGVLRVYIDGEPVVEDSILHIIAGDALAEYPLQASVSPDTEDGRKGHNLYFPIPYRESCKITYTCDALSFPNPTHSPKVYYNINYRSYASGTQIESFSLQSLEVYSAEIKQAYSVLKNGPGAHPKQMEHLLRAKIPPDSSLVLPFYGQEAINSIQLSLDAPDVPQAFRSTVVQISFDGFPSIWAPIGDFFGTGFEFHPYQSWYSQLSEGGMFSSYWVMPYQYKAELRLINFGEQEVSIRGNVGTIPYEWQEKRSMYFGANWQERASLMPVGILNPEPNTRPEDLCFVELIDKGVYVGDVLTLYNTDDAWWGEGDEKIYVDGEPFPSSFGTGTEDYYGYAWARPEAFSHPFIAQPTGEGNFYPGMTVNLRQRALDAIPFQNRFKMDMELLHWVSTPINYASTSFFYTRSPFMPHKVNQAHAVKNPIPRNREDLIPIGVDSTGFIEGEQLRVVFGGDRITRTQYDPSVGWSNQGHLWWRTAKPGDSLQLEFEVHTSGNFQLSLGMSQAKDYGIIQFMLNGKRLPVEFDGYCTEGISLQTLSLGKFALQEGVQQLVLISKGKHESAEPNYMAGIDWLRAQKRE